MGVLAYHPGAELGFVPRGPPEAPSWPGWSITPLARVSVSLVSMSLSLSLSLATLILSISVYVETPISLFPPFSPCLSPLCVSDAILPLSPPLCLSGPCLPATSLSPHLPEAEGLWWPWTHLKEQVQENCLTETRRAQCQASGCDLYPGKQNAPTPTPLHSHHTPA